MDQLHHSSIFGTTIFKTNKNSVNVKKLKTIILDVLFPVTSNQIIQNSGNISLCVALALSEHDGNCLTCSKALIHSRNIKFLPKYLIILLEYEEDINRNLQKRKDFPDIDFEEVMLLHESRFQLIGIVNFQGVW